MSVDVRDELSFTLCDKLKKMKHLTTYQLAHVDSWSSPRKIAKKNFRDRALIAQIPKSCLWLFDILSNETCSCFGFVVKKKSLSQACDYYFVLQIFVWGSATNICRAFNISRFPLLSTIAQSVARAMLTIQMQNMDIILPGALHVSTQTESMIDEPGKTLFTEKEIIILTFEHTNHRNCISEICGWNMIHWISPNLDNTLEFTSTQYFQKKKWFSQISNSHNEQVNSMIFKSWCV